MERAEQQEPPFVSTWQEAIEADGLPPEDDIDPISKEALEAEIGGNLEQEIYDIFAQNYAYIRTHYHMNNQIQNSYTFRSSLYVPTACEELKHLLRVIYLQEPFAYKLNFSFSFLLKKTDTEDDQEMEEYRVFLAHTNNFLFYNEPPTIITQDDLDQAVDLITDEELQNTCLLAREDTKWSFETFLSVSVYITKLRNDVPKGKMVDVPAYIKNNKFVEALPSRKLDGRPLDFPLAICFFHCLAYDQNKTNYRALAKDLYRQFQEFLVAKGLQQDVVPVNLFPGVTLKLMALAEECFQKDCQVWEMKMSNSKKTQKRGRRLKMRQRRYRRRRRQRNPFILGETEVSGEDASSDEETSEFDADSDGFDYEEQPDEHETSVYETTAYVQRYSMRRYPQSPILHLLSHVDHLFFIKDIEKMAKRYSCNFCSRVFPTKQRLTHHINGRKPKRKSDAEETDVEACCCSKGETKREWPGGSAGPSGCLFDELALQTGIRVPKNLRFYDWTIGFDTECYFPRPSRNSDRYKSHDDPANVDRPLKPIFWQTDHDTDNNKPKGLSVTVLLREELGNGRDRIVDFLRREWKNYRSSHAKADQWRIRVCCPSATDDWANDFEPDPDQDDFMGRIFLVRPNHLLDASRLRQFLIYALSRPSYDSKADVLVTAVRLMVCVKENGRYKLVESCNVIRTIFSECPEDEKPTILDWTRAKQTVENWLGTDHQFFLNLKSFWSGISGDEGEAFRPIVGLLAFQCEFQSKRLSLMYKLIPLSVVLQANYKPFDKPRFLYNPGPDETDPTDDEEKAGIRLVDRFVDLCLEMASAAERLAMARMKPYWKALLDRQRRQMDECAQLRETLELLKEDFDPKEGNLMRQTKRALAEEHGLTPQDIAAQEDAYRFLKVLDNLRARFLKWIRMTPIIGFNSGGFDLPFFRFALFPRLLDLQKAEAEKKTDEDKTIRCFARSKRYLAVFSERLLFLDALSYTAHCSYENFLKQFQISTICKLDFCYEYVKHPKDLLSPLPPIEEWSSWLRNTRCSEEKYAQIQKHWTERGFSSLLELLEEYNIADVTGLLLATDKIRAFWRERFGLDAFKQGFISLPGLAFESMFRSLPPFTIIAYQTAKYAHIHDKLQANLVAGPSIIFNRLALRGETTLPDGNTKVHSIFGFDANSLYAGCFLEPICYSVGVSYEPVETTKTQDPDIVSARVPYFDADWYMAGAKRAPSPSVDYGPGTSETLAKEEEWTEELLNALADATETRSEQEEEDDRQRRRATYGMQLENATLDDDPKENTEINLDNVTFKGRSMQPYWRESAEWLAWRSKEYRERGLCVDHQPFGKMFNGKEIGLGGRFIRVDGVCPNCCTIHQFHGCYFHGHDCHLTRIRADGVRRMGKEPMDPVARRERTSRVTEYLTGLHGKQYLMDITYECEWKALKKANREIVQREEKLEKQTKGRVKATTESMGKYLRTLFPPDPRNVPLTGRQLLTKVMEGTFTGFVEIDCHVAPEWRRFMNLFPPIFKHQTITREFLKSPMKEYVEERGLLKGGQRLLISSLSATKWLISTTYLRYLLQHCHLRISAVHSAIFFHMKPICGDFFRTILNERKLAQDAGQTALATALKLLLNAIYGRSCIRKERFLDTFIADTETVLRWTGHPRFRKLDMIKDNEYYQISLKKRKTNMNVLIQTAIAILCTAKIDLLSFAIEFVLRFLYPKVQLMLCDTDSLFFAGAHATLDEHVEAEKWDDYCRAKAKFLVNSPEEKNTPHKWKLETQPDTHTCIALSSKCYYLESGSEETKQSVVKCKGANKKINTLKKESFLACLRQREQFCVVNKGFKMSNDGRMYSYRLAKRAMHYMYIKRSVRPDGVTTDALDYNWEEEEEPPSTC